MANHGDVPFFFVRGAFSIDWQFRQEYDLANNTKCWWAEEELSYAQMTRCLAEYSVIKPDTVISHDCPVSVSRKISNGKILINYGYDPETFETNTGRLLQAMFEKHQPKIWVFAHYHKKVDTVINGTRFVCRPEFGTFDL
jgi:hypothetical protein